MGKSEFFLQVVIFGMTAAVVALFAARIYPSSLFNRDHTPSAQEQTNIAQTVAKNANPPSSISIPAVDINLTVAAATIVGDNWTLYDDKASWLTTSKTPGNGNVILFAHNKDHLFGRVRQIQIGQEIVVGQGEKKITYVVSQKRQVTPKDIDAVLSNDNQLTLYTCDGSFDQKRLIVIALPKSV